VNNWILKLFGKSDKDAALLSRALSTNRHKGQMSRELSAHISSYPVDASTTNVNGLPDVSTRCSKSLESRCQLLCITGGNVHRDGKLLRKSQSVMYT
jgi:hypothetical protein